MTMMPSELDFPFANAANLRDEVFLPRVSAIREADPVFYSASQRGWLLCRHEDVFAAFGDPRWSAVRLSVTQYDAIPMDQHEQLIPNLKKYVGEWTINIDGPKHERIRKVVVKAFNRKLVEGLRPMVERACDKLLDAAIAEGEVDFVEAVAYPLPAMVIISLLGVSPEYIGPLRDWARVLTVALASHSPSREILLQAEATIVEMNRVFEVEFDKRRASPGNDLLSVLVSAHEGGESLSKEELLGLCHLLIIAGHDTTANSIALGLIALVRHPEQRKRYLAGDVDSMQAMSELLRYVAMSSVQPRIAKEPMEIRGKQINPGEVGYLMIAAANRDPRVFERPDEFDVGRANLEQSVTFGPGLHHCLGHYLARMELDILYRQLFARTSNVELLPQEYSFTPNFVFRTVERIPVRLTV